MSDEGQSERRPRRGLLEWLRGEKSRPDATGRFRIGDAQGVESELTTRYADQGEIARGGMSSIRRVLDRNLRRHAAMKVIDPGAAAAANGVQRFIEEAQVTGQLEHPNVVPVYDFGADVEGTRYLTMKLVRGSTLQKLLDDEGPWFKLPRTRQFDVLGILLTVCDAVAYAHTRGVVHCDLKPDNIMVGDFGQVYLMDWGIAHLRRDDDTGRTPTAERIDVPDPTPRQPGIVTGTVAYAAPEQARGHVDAIDERTDVFLLGAVLYAVLTGRAPYDAKDPRVQLFHAHQCQWTPIDDVIGADATVPRALKAIVERAMSKDPAARFASVVELKGELERFVRAGGSFPTALFRAGEHLMHEDEEGDSLFILERGQVQVYKTQEDGRRRGLATLGAGGVVGEIAVLSRQRRTASVVAIEDVVATVVDRATLEAELATSGWLGALVRAVADRFVVVDDRLDKMKGALEMTQMRTLLLEELALSGRDAVDGAREVAWPPLRARLARHFVKSEAEVEAALSRMGGFELFAGVVLRLQRT